MHYFYSHYCLFLFSAVVYGYIYLSFMYTIHEVNFSQTLLLVTILNKTTEQPMEKYYTRVMFTFLNLHLKVQIWNRLKYKNLQ